MIIIMIVIIIIIIIIMLLLLLQFGRDIRSTLFGEGSFASLGFRGC